MAGLFPLMGFLIIALFYRLVPSLLPGGLAFWLLYAIGAIVLARHVARLTGLKGLADCGAHAHYGWLRNVRVGFLMGFFMWAIMYVCFGRLSIDVYGAPEYGQQAGWTSALQLPVWLLAPLLYEWLIRGYLYAQLGSRLSAAPFVLLTSSLCALEQAWSTGLDGREALLAFASGLPLGYLLYRTGSIWLSAGLHAGMRLVEEGMRLATNSGDGLWQLGAPVAPLVAAACLLAGARMLLKRCRINVASPTLKNGKLRK